MKLSIIIVNFNTAQLTLECIDSIFNHAPEFPFEVIVIDNNSTDNSVAVLSKLRKIILIKNDKNVGFSKANNQGIKIAKGEYLFLLNSDTKITKDIFSELIKITPSLQNAGVIAPQLLNPDLSIQPSIFRFPTISRAISQYWLKSSKDLDKYALEGDDAREVEVVVGAAFLITPEAKKRVGTLSERYFMYFEDFDYCRRVYAAQLKVYYIPSLSVIHIHGASGKPGINKLLIESSKIYFGTVRYYLYTFILWSGQKMQRLVS